MDNSAVPRLQRQQRVRSLSAASTEVNIDYPAHDQVSTHYVPSATPGNSVDDLHRRSSTAMAHLDRAVRRGLTILAEGQLAFEQAHASINEADSIFRSAREAVRIDMNGAQLMAMASVITAHLAGAVHTKICEAHLRCILVSMNDVVPRLVARYNESETAIEESPSGEVPGKSF